MRNSLCHNVALVLSEDWPIPPGGGKPLPALATAVQVVAVLLTEEAEAREIVQYLAWVEKHHLERSPDRRRLEEVAARLLSLWAPRSEPKPAAGNALPGWVAKTIAFAGGLTARRA